VPSRLRRVKPKSREKAAISAATCRTSTSVKIYPDDFKRKMLYDNPVRFYRFSEGDIAAARKAKAN
jgi:hypothetical protein